MFTGIIEEVGTVSRVIRKGENAELQINCSLILDDVRVGDSIAVDGVCLTVTKNNENNFIADVSYETISKTTLSSIKNNDKVNLERALTLNSRLGGHLVLGHVDCVGIVKQIRFRGESIELSIGGFDPIKQYIAKKGSIAVNGISLTVSDLGEDYFTVAVIPHTFEVTTLKYKKPGDGINLEVDVIARYVERLLQNRENNNRLEKMLVDYDW
ncbi:MULTISPECIES: riboflavin synthase [Calditerrivibrio]|uniref:Riboflavin synthase n=1 Tax=Calditerrivibrio nitroreducens TaxID=477976 RepID=A0A2J6WPN6_9BACT|nr:MAG: riboflavin synthase [Calditerrivibrio nitroreducens]